MVSLNLSITENKALNQDGITALRSLSLVQGQTYDIAVSLFSGVSQVAPTVSNFSFVLSDNKGASLVSLNSISPNGSGYIFSLPLVSPAIGFSPTYSGSLSFTSAGTQEIIEPFNVSIAPSAYTLNTAGYVSSLNNLTSDITIAGGGSVSVSTNGQAISIFGSASSGSYYPLTGNPSSYLTASALTSYALQSALNATGTGLQSEIMSIQGQSGSWYPRTNPSGYLSLVPSDVVRTSGNQTISGQKTFSAMSLFPSGASGVFHGTGEFTGTLTLNGLPAYRSQLYAVANESARFSYGSYNGDVINQQSNSHYYLVVDDTNLGNALGYYDLGTYRLFPILDTAPSLSAVPTQGTEVDTDNGTWENSPTSYAYQWQTSPDHSTWSNISGATTNAYTPTCDDVGLWMRVKLTATNAHGSTVGYSDSFSTVEGSPANTSAPNISGTPNTANTLTVDNGSWNSCSDLSYSYSWSTSSDGSSWSGAEHDSGANTYSPTSDEMGLYIKASVTATNSAGSTGVDSNVLQFTDAPSVGDNATIQDDNDTGGGGPTSAQWVLHVFPVSEFQDGDKIQFHTFHGDVYFWLNCSGGGSDPGGDGTGIMLNVDIGASSLVFSQSVLEPALNANNFSCTDDGDNDNTHITITDGTAGAGDSDCEITIQNQGSGPGIEQVSFTDGSDNSGYTPVAGDTLSVSSDASFIVVSDTPTVTTQWFQNGSPLSGETNSTLSTSSYGAGAYYIIQDGSNSWGDAQSQSNTITLS